MNGFERRKEQKKENIRRAALELFRSHGFNKVTISDIANKAGVSPVTIYNHFGSKDELVLDIVKTQFQTLLGKFQQVMKGELPFVEKLQTIVFDKTALASQFQGEWIQAVVQGNPELQQFIETVYQQELNQLMVDFFEEGKNQGFINPELSQEAIMLYLDIFRKGIFANSNLIANIKNSEKLMLDLITISLYGLMGKK
jgi:AcrR family transcriptional regulator